MDDLEAARLIGKIAGADLAWKGNDFLVAHESPIPPELMDTKVSELLDGTIAQAQEEYPDLFSDTTAMRAFLRSLQASHSEEFDRLTNLRISTPMTRKRARRSKLLARPAT